MANGRAGRRYPKQSIIQQKLNHLKTEGYEPTTDFEDEHYEGTAQRASYLEGAKDASLPSVRPSETSLARLKKAAIEYSSILGWLGLVVSAATAIMYLRYDVSHIKEDVITNKEDIKEISGKIVDVENNQTKTEENIKYLNSNVLKIEKTIEINQNDIKKMLIDNSK